MTPVLRNMKKYTYMLPLTKSSEYFKPIFFNLVTKFLYFYI